MRFLSKTCFIEVHIEGILSQGATLVAHQAAICHVHSPRVKCFNRVVDLPLFVAMHHSHGEGCSWAMCGCIGTPTPPSRHPGGIGGGW